MSPFTLMQRGCHQSTGVVTGVSYNPTASQFQNAEPLKAMGASHPSASHSITSLPVCKGINQSPGALRHTTHKLKLPVLIATSI